MKKKTIIFLLIILVSFFSFNIKSYAMTLPWFTISSNNYSDGDKMILEEIDKVEVGKSLQLHGLIIHGNDVLYPEYPDSMGIFVDESNLSNITWSSSDTSIAVVNNSGKITGISEGTVTITATYNEETANCEITVTPYTGIWIATEEPESAKILNENYEFQIYLYNN